MIEHFRVRSSVTMDTLQLRGPSGMAVILYLFLFVISGGKQCRTTSGDGDVYFYSTGSVIVRTTAGMPGGIWLHGK